MNPSKQLFLLIPFIFCFTKTIQAQVQDSIVVYDTVTIQKAPYVINKTVVMPYNKKVTSPRFFIAAIGGLQYYRSYSNVCEQCKDFYETTLTTNKPSLGYSGGLEFMYKPGRFFYTLKFLHTLYRERFNFTDSSNSQYHEINKLSYFDNLIGGGLRIGKEKNIQLLLSAEAKLSILNSINGLIPDSASQQSAVAIKELHHYRKTVPGVAISVKLFTKVFRKIYLMPELGYSFDLRSIVENEGPYTIQRHIPSLKLSLIKGF